MYNKIQQKLSFQAKEEKGKRKPKLHCTCNLLQHPGQKIKSNTKKLWTMEGVPNSDSLNQTTSLDWTANAREGGGKWVGCMPPLSLSLLKINLMNGFYLPNENYFSALSKWSIWTKDLNKTMASACVFWVNQDSNFQDDIGS